MDASSVIEQLRQLQKQLRSNQFRSDIPFRINVASQVPPLVSFDAYYENQATKASFVLIKHGFSNEMYVNQKAELDSIITQAITKLSNNPNVLQAQIAEKQRNRIPRQNHIVLAEKSRAFTNMGMVFWFAGCGFCRRRKFFNNKSI